MKLINWIESTCESQSLLLSHFWLPEKPSFCFKFASTLWNLFLAWICAFKVRLMFLTAVLVQFLIRKCILQFINLKASCLSFCLGCFQLEATLFAYWLTFQIFMLYYINYCLKTVVPYKPSDVLSKYRLGEMISLVSLKISNVTIHFVPEQRKAF